MTVRKAVIPAAGLGTRFLPASKAQPKEMITVVDKPGIQYVVEEAARAGLDDILIVTSRNKSSVEDHFDRSLELEHHLEEAGKDEQLAEVRAIPGLAQIHYVRQKEPLGFGHAVFVARRHVGDEPFAVMVPDEIVPSPKDDEIDLMPKMLEVYERHGDKSVVAVVEVPKEEAVAYGVVDPDWVEDGVARIKDMIEKPTVQESPSNLASRGRYVFTPEIFDALERTAAGVGDEIQLTDGIRILAQEQGAFAYVFNGRIMDVGKKLDYLKATVELALRRDDLGASFKSYLEELVPRLG
ncbi:MAG: UTP--glucose-1-phosphate uridylyltransferase GalU [Actinobacteria bacterium]|nr:UTP--glucose-1-phosphate uridylyltransferase GalU [Actinomycetota bacterium]